MEEFHFITPILISTVPIYSLVECKSPFSIGYRTIFKSKSTSKLNF